MLPIKKVLGSDPEAAGIRASLVKYKGDLSVALAEATATATKRYILCRGFHWEYGMSRVVVCSGFHSYNVYSLKTKFFMFVQHTSHGE